MTGRGKDKPYHYRLYGMTIRSALRLPYLLPAESGDDNCDVEIGFADLTGENFGEGLRFRNWHAREGEMVLNAPEIGLFRISGGHRILIDPATGANDADLVSFVQGSCMAALLQQRRILPMHSSAIATDHGAVLTIGRSGAGKSTLLAALLQAGCTMMADDVTGLVFDESGAPIALPAFPAIRLWRDTLIHLGHDPSPLVRVRDDIEKYYLPIERFRDTPLPVRLVILLGRNNDSESVVRPIPLSRRVECLARYVHRKKFLRGLDLMQYGFESVTRMAERIDMVSISRPSLNPTPETMARNVLDHLAEAGIGVKPGDARVS